MIFIGKKNINLTVDEEILKEFDSEYENRSRKVEEFMENAVIGTSKIDKLKKEFEEIGEEIKELEHRRHLISERIENLESDENRNENLEKFFTNEAEKFEKGRRKKWDDFNEFWKELGSGIIKKFRNKGFDPESEDLKDEIRKRAEN